MSITDELREWWVRKFPVMDKELHENFAAIADRIDAEHERAVMSAMNDALYHANDESMAELGWVRLPKDADGECIHVGDVMEFTYDPPQDQPLFEVSGIGADGTLFYAPRGEVFPRKSTKASVVRHYHAPTVEDVLLEACKAYHGLMTESMSDVAHDMPAPSEIIAEYAAKLRLAEGEDE